MGPPRGFSRIHLSDDYNVDAGTLGGNVTNQEVDFGDVKIANQFYISNDGGRQILLKWIGETEDNFELQAGEVLTLTGLEVQKMYLTNPTATAVAYRILIWGN